MSEISLTLYIDLEQGSRIDLDVLANAALAWSNLIKVSGQQVDPFTDWHVELESALPGSQKLKSIIRLPQNAETRGMIKGALLASILFVFKEAIAWGVSEVLEYLTGGDAPSEVQMLPESERQKLAEEIVLLLRGGQGAAEAKDVYKALKEDEKVQGVGVTANSSGRPSFVVGRSEFSSRTDDEKLDDKVERTKVETIELTLIRPVLTTDTSRRWGFQSSFGSFGAPIRDQSFLKTLSEGRLNVPMTQGIRMVVEIEITEEQVGAVWRPVDRVIIRVINVIPPPQQESFDLSGPQ